MHMVLEGRTEKENEAKALAFIEYLLSQGLVLYRCLTTSGCTDGAES